MIRKPVYFRGQGVLKAALIDADGNIGPYQWLGNVSALALKPTVETIEHTEDYTGMGFTDFRMNHSPKLGFSFTADDYLIDTLALLTWGEKETLTTQPVVGRVVDGPFEPGKFYRIGRPGIAVTSLTAGGSPIAASKYTVHFDGTVSFTEAVAGNITVAGSEVAIDGFAVLSKSTQSVALKFSGMNTAQSNKKFAVDIPYGTLMPLSELALVGRTDLASYSVEGMALYDGKASQNGLFDGLAEVFVEK